MNKKYIIKFNDKYLVETPSWNSGTWTDKKEEATIYSEYDTYDFYTKHYPQFELIEIP